MQNLELKKVETNNLKGLDISIPSQKLTVVSGVSGSGKSSLVFDTLYGESYRRYVESLSSFARQYLKALPKPKIGSAEGLPPAIAVKQARSTSNSRSTVGTMSEVSDLLRILYTHVSDPYCPDCDVRVSVDDGDSVAKSLTQEHPGEKALILAPLDAWQKISAKDLKEQLVSQGFTRALKADGEIVRINQLKAAELKKSQIVVDRVTIDEDFQRLAEATTLALKVGRKKMIVKIGDREQKYSAFFGCDECGRELLKATLALFSFNHPYGACEHCQGFGREPTIDWNKVFPDLDSSLADDGVAVWNFGSHVEMYREAKASARRAKIRFAKPFREYSAAEWRWLKYGSEDFDGVQGYYEWVESKRHKAHYRIHAARFRKYVTCSVCNGARLNDDGLAYRIGGMNIASVNQLNAGDAKIWIEQLTAKLSEEQLRNGVKEALEELLQRLGYLERMGLAYLTLDRHTRTLSGGEAQRINMARCLGSALTDTMYCLDEPSCGLHSRDSRRLLEVLYELRDQGNTVVVVEHERALIEGSDHLIEIGPQAGHLGGFKTFAGAPGKRKSGTESWHSSENKTYKSFVELKGAATHNLKSINVKIPLGAMTVVCGVSGSGKTSLIQHTLYPLLAKHFGVNVEGVVEEPVAKSIGPAASLRKLSRIVHVSQTAMGRSSRSNIATYLGIFTEIRKLFAATKEAKALGLKATNFSFNSKGGRCETCHGLGTVVEDLSFLGDMEVICPGCEGQRFSDAVLSVYYRGKNLNDLLKMTVNEVRELFHDVRALVRVLDEIIAMGLGYLNLGQSTSTFSGGEAQRVKLLRLLKDSKSYRQPSMLIFDEPTTGLSDQDVLVLIDQLHDLRNAGHSVVVVEHHLGMMASADWLIEIGPEAASEGGALVYQGAPSGLAKVKASRTAKFLSPLMGNA